MAECTGKFKLESSENFEEYMKALGVGMIMRKMGNSLSPVTEITQNGDEWTIKTSTTFKTTEIKFKLGEPFEEERMDGEKCTSTVTKEGNKLIHVMKGSKDTTMIREFEGDTLKMTLTVDDIVCTRVYKRCD